MCGTIVSNFSMRNLRIARMVRAELNVVHTLRFRRGYPPQLSKDLNLEVRGEDFPRTKHFLQTKVSPATVKPPTFYLVVILKVESKEMELELGQTKKNRYPCIYQRTWKTH